MSTLSTTTITELKEERIFTVPTFLMTLLLALLLLNSNLEHVTSQSKFLKLQATQLFDNSLEQVVIKLKLLFLMLTEETLSLSKPALIPLLMLAGMEFLNLETTLLWTMLLLTKLSIQTLTTEELQLTFKL